LAEPLAIAPPSPSLPTPSRRWSRRISWAVLLLFGGFFLSLAAGALWVRSQIQSSMPQLDGEVELAGLSAPVTVERDALGVPTIQAGNRNDAARALGFLHAQDRFFQMDLLRRSAAGELSALFGTIGLSADRQNRVHRFRNVAGRVLARATPEERAIVTAYAEGINAGLAALGAKPWEYLFLRTEPTPWLPEDTILVVQAMFLDLQGGDWGYESDIGLIQDLLPRPLAELLTPIGTEWDAPIVGAPMSTPPIPGPEVFDLRKEPPVQLPQAARTQYPLFPAAEASTERLILGSNNWAVAGAHTADGRALLANDMHLALRVPNTWYRASMVRPDGAGGEIRVTGVSLPGIPTISAGSNGHVAWGFTNSYGDWFDLVLLEVDPRNPEVYLTPAGPRRFDKVEEIIEVKGGEPFRLEIRQTIWGPVIDRDHRGRLRALAWAPQQPEAVNLALLGFETARTLEEAMLVANRSGTPAQNFVVADASGRIGWTIFGRIPRRVGFDGRIPTSWADGIRRWDGWLLPEEVPRIVDPLSGRIWTANSRVVDGDPLAKLGDGGYAFGARARQIRDRLFALEKATPQDMLAIQLDDRALFLERWRKVLLDVLTPEAVTAKPRRDELRRLVETTWTGHASIDSTAYRLVRDWHGFVQQQVLAPITARCKKADERFDSILPQSEGAVWALVTARPAHLLDPRHRTWNDALLAAVDSLLEQYEKEAAGFLEPRKWGERNMTRIRHPLGGALPFIGRWINIPPRSLPGDVHMPRVQGPGFGASERLVVSPGREQEGFFHMPAGQSGHPMSSLYRAGHEAWEEGKPTPFLPGPAEHVLKLMP
jgi:penicillin G amidase